MQGGAKGMDKQKEPLRNRECLVEKTMKKQQRKGVM